MAHVPLGVAMVTPSFQFFHDSPVALVTSESQLENPQDLVFPPHPWGVLKSVSSQRASLLQDGGGVLQGWIPRGCG